MLPIALPGNILGMVLLLVLLGTHILKTKYISDACDYLIDNMSVFFIPAGVAIMGCFSILEAAAAKFAFVCIATTVIVFLATSYTVLFVSWIMAKLGKDTALAPAVGSKGSDDNAAERRISKTPIPAANTPMSSRGTTRTRTPTPALIRIRREPASSSRPSPARRLNLC